MFLLQLILRQSSMVAGMTALIGLWGAAHPCQHVVCESEPLRREGTSDLKPEISSVPGKQNDFTEQMLFLSAKT